MTATGVQLKDLSKTYNTPAGPIEAVRGIDLTLAPGETVAFLGPNGAGKSTTLEMLLGLTPPDAGNVSIFGRPPRDAIDTGSVGAMLQSAGLVRDLTVRELLEMMASLFPNPLGVDTVLELVGLQHASKQRTQKLSGGQTQRARFAIAIVSDPELLVLDEPTAAMDVEARHAFWMTMRELASRGKTIVFATHYLEEADAYADRVVLMAAGEIVADGAPTSIKALVGSRTLRATLPGIDVALLARLTGVAGVERHGDAIQLRCTDSDAALRELLGRFPAVRDIEIQGAQLEQAFLELTKASHAR